MCNGYCIVYTLAVHVTLCSVPVYSIQLYTTPYTLFGPFNLHITVQTLRNRTV